MTFLKGDTDFWILFIIILLRYIILTTLAFLVFYVIGRRRWFYIKIQKKFPLPRDYFREISYSILTAMVFTAVGILVFASPLTRHTQAYFDITQHSTGYFIFSIVLMILIHDTYFYWTHRWMHTKNVFRMVHRVHHLSTNPSPWAALAFHPLEAVIEAGVIIVFAFVIPVHPLALGIFLLFMMTYNVYGHLGYELYPKGFSESKTGKWINTSVHHNQHHEFFTGNYGLYFLWWDRWMGTLRGGRGQIQNPIFHPPSAGVENSKSINQPPEV